ncbi:MAG: translation initiation factor, partial [Thermodesulfobacteriota bacterium]|nr:translation initiation factor [Thermodesulfobacteriota bacterium]
MTAGGVGIAISRQSGKPDKTDKTNINQDIRAKEVRVIDPEGNQVGVLPTYRALAAASDFGLDLVEISP